MVFYSGSKWRNRFYYYKITELDREIWKNEIETNIKARELRDIINKSINIGYYWSFRKSIGQPGIINLAYGLIAASLAEITGGFVYSDDGAWDYSYFPALPEDFFRWYFKPEQLSPTAQSIAKPLVSGKYCNNNGYEKINHTQPCKQNIKKPSEK